MKKVIHQSLACKLKDLLAKVQARFDHFASSLLDGQLVVRTKKKALRAQLWMMYTEPFNDHGLEQIIF